MADSGGCGVANLSIFGRHKEKILRSTNPGGYREGDLVEILLSEAIFIRSILIQYLLPLISMALFTAIFHLLYDQIMLDISAAIAGLYSGIQLAGYLIKRIQQQFSTGDFCIRNLDCSPVKNIQTIKVIQT